MGLDHAELSMSLDGLNTQPFCTECVDAGCRAIQSMMNGLGAAMDLAALGLQSAAGRTDRVGR